MKYDVAIIGAGVIGGFIARELSRYDLKVCLIERENDVGMGASRANSAIVHAGFDAEPGTLKALLNVKGSEMMEQVAGELGVPYRRNTSIVVGFCDEDLPKLQTLLDRGNKNGVRDLKIISGDEARALEPKLGPTVKYALLAPTGAIVCPYELTIAAIGNAMDNGVTLVRNFEVKSIRKEGNFYQISSGVGDDIEAARVINCAGVYSDKIASFVGACDFTITPRRGEYLLLDKECGNMVSATIFRTPTAMGKGILVTRTVDGNLLMGPTAENITDKEDTSTTDAGLASVRTMAEEMVPGIPGRCVITSFCGLRSVGDKGDFIINNPIPGFVNVAAIESPGLSSSPAIAEYVVELLKKDGAVLNARPDFNPIRRPAHWFRHMSLAEKNKVIAEKPAYGRIICRCESVTEGEIKEALVTNPRPMDVDGVKRRTRSGMGRCQGGFCQPNVIGLLAQELGIPFEDVTKCGGDSKLMFGRTRGGKM